MALSDRDKLILKARAQLELRQRQQAPTEEPEVTEPSLLQQAQTAITEGIDVPPSIQRAAQIVETPIRIGRGIGLGVGEAVKGVEAQLAPTVLPGVPVRPEVAPQIVEQLPAAVEAFKRGLDPDFTPQNTREEIFGTIGELGTVLPITAPILSMTAKHPGIGGAVTFGTLHTIRQAARDGRIVPLDIAKEAAIAGVLPIINPTIQQTVRGSKAVLKGLFKRSAKVDEEALDALLENPQLLNQFTGLRSAITEKAVNVQRAIAKAHAQVGQVLSKYKEDTLGIVSRLEDPIVTRVPKTAEQLDETFNVLSNSIKTKALPDNKLIERALELRNDIYELITFKPGVTLPPLQGKVVTQLKNRANRINEMISGLKGGKRLRLIEKAYSDITKSYESIQNKLSTPGKIEDFFTKFMRKEGDLDEALGTPSEILEKLRKIEQRSKMSIIKPLIREISSRQFKEIAPQGFSGSILAAIAAALAVTQRPALAATIGVVSSPRGVAFVLPKAQRVGRILKQAGNIMARADTRALIGSLNLLYGNETQEVKETK